MSCFCKSKSSTPGLWGCCCRTARPSCNISQLKSHNFCQQIWFATSTNDCKPFTKSRESNSLHNWLFNLPIGYSFLAYHQFAILIRLWPIFRLWGKYHQNVILTVLWSNHFVSGDMTGKTLCHMTQIKAWKRIALLKSFVSLKVQIWVQIFCWSLFAGGGRRVGSKFYHSRWGHPAPRIPIPSDQPKLPPAIIIIFRIIPLIAYLIFVSFLQDQKSPHDRISSTT